MVTVTVPLLLSSVAFNTDPQLIALVAIAFILELIAWTVTNPPARLEFPASSVTCNNTWFVWPTFEQVKLELFIANVRFWSQLSDELLLISDAVIVASPSALRVTVRFCATAVGAVLSTTKALFAPRDPEAPVALSVRVASFPAASLIVPPFSANALVDA